VLIGGCAQHRLGIGLYESARRKGMAAGLEPELSVVVDVLFPIAAVTEAAKEFREKFPGTPLRLYVEALGAAYQPVIDGHRRVRHRRLAAASAFGPDGGRLMGVTMVMVAARDHPLAKYQGTIPKSELAKMCSWFSPTAPACRKDGNSA